MDYKTIYTAIFNKQDIFYVSIESPVYVKHTWKIGRTQKRCTNTYLQLMFPTAFLVFPDLTNVLVEFCYTDANTQENVL